MNKVDRRHFLKAAPLFVPAAHLSAKEPFRGEAEGQHLVTNGCIPSRDDPPVTYDGIVIRPALTGFQNWVVDLFDDGNKFFTRVAKNYVIQGRVDDRRAGIASKSDLRERLLKPYRPMSYSVGGREVEVREALILRLAIAEIEDSPEYLVNILARGIEHIEDSWVYRGWDGRCA